MSYMAEIEIKEFIREMSKLNSCKRFPYNVVGLDLSRAAEYYIAVKLIIKYVGLVGSSILDVGTYLSPLPAWLANNGATVIGIDIDTRLRYQLSIQKLIGGNLQLILADALNLPFRKRIFDCVTLISTIEHFTRNEDIEFMSLIPAYITRRGIIVITVPYGEYKEGRWGRWFQRTYDWQAVRQRLVLPSGLTLLEHGWLFGAGIGKIYDLWYSLPAAVRHALGWFRWWQNLDLATPATPDDARVCWLVLGLSEFGL